MKDLWIYSALLNMSSIIVIICFIFITILVIKAISAVVICTKGDYFDVESYLSKLSGARKYVIILVIILLGSIFVPNNDIIYMKLLSEIEIRDKECQDAYTKYVYRLMIEKIKKEYVMKD